jgi:hypothetical protein
MTMLRKALSAGAVVVVLASLPSPLAAQQTKAPDEVHTSVLERFSTFWSELTAWFAGETAPPRTGTGVGGGATTQGSCATDPNGGCTPGG